MPHGQRVSIHPLPVHFGRILTGSEGGQSQPAEDTPRILAQLASHRIDGSGFISHRGSLTYLEEIVGRMRSGEVIHAAMRLGDD